jgi:hypothetical protein
MPSFAEVIGAATDQDTTTDTIKKTTLVGPLAVSLSEALNEAYAVMPNIDEAQVQATESQQISAVQKSRLVDSLPKNFAEKNIRGSTHTTIYAVRRNEIRPEDVTQIFNRISNINTSGYPVASVRNNKPFVILLDISTTGEVKRTDLGVSEGIALAVESMCKARGVPVVSTPQEALMVNVVTR